MSPAAARLAAELDAEFPITRRVLERVPTDRLAWQPHPKSLTLGQLAEHIARIPGNVAKLAEADVFDIAARPITYPPGESTDAILAAFDQSVSAITTALASMDEARAEAPWRMVFGEREIFARPRIHVMRAMGLNHMIHHRGELVVYLRLLDVPVPVVYGRSADENPLALPASAPAKLEFMSPAWIAMAREVIRRALAGKDLKGVRFTLCEEFTNPPEHLKRAGAETIGFYVRLDDGHVDVGDRPTRDADCTVISDYAEALSVARDPDAAAADPTAMAERVAAGRLRIIGNLSAAPAVLAELDIHRLLVPFTA